MAYRGCRDPTTRSRGGSAAPPHCNDATSAFLLWSCSQGAFLDACLQMIAIDNGQRALRIIIRGRERLQLQSSCPAAGEDDDKEPMYFILSCQLSWGSFAHGI